MVSTFTTARSLEKPAAGDQVGTWGTASINPDLDVIDAGMGQSVAISGSAGNVVLAAGQFRCAQITFNSTLVGSISATFPTSFTGPYTIYNACSGSSNFIITMGTTVFGGEVICAPPGELVDIFNDGTNLRYRNLERIGTLVPTLYSSMPAWISNCTKPPYLNTDGTVFSSASFPFLAVVLNGTTLPDYRGRFQATLNQGTGRITSAQVGLDGDTRGASGGVTALASTHLPQLASLNHTHVYRDRYLVETAANVSSEPFQEGVPGGNYNNNAGNQGLDFDNNTFLYLDATSSTALSGISYGSSSQVGFVPPTAVAGITMIRAA